MNAQHDGLNTTGGNVSKALAWLDVYMVTLEAFRKAHALEGLGVHDCSARNDVDVALGRLGMLEYCCPIILRDDSLITEGFDELNEIAVKRSGKRLTDLRSPGVV